MEMIDISAPETNLSVVLGDSTTSPGALNTTTQDITTQPDTFNVTIEELNDLATQKYLSVLIICILIMFIGIIGNILVLVIYKLKFKRSSARTYILALAVADISVCVVGIPYHVMDLTMLLVYRYSNACKVLSFLIGACTNSSIYILLVVALDRYLKVCRPLKKQIIDFGDRRACLIAVGLATLMSIPNGILYGHSTVPTWIEGLKGVQCFIDDSFVEGGFAVAFMGVNILLFVIFLIFLVIIYGFICRKIYQQDKMEGNMKLTKSNKGCCSCIKQDEEDWDDEVEEIAMEDGANLSKVGEGEKDEEKSDDEAAPLTEDKTEPPKQGKNPAKTAAKGRPKQKLTRPPSSGMVRHVQNKEKNTRKITLMMLTITAVFVISYVPFVIISILTAMSAEFWDDLDNFGSVMTDFILRMYLINNAANPIIYSFWDVRFRRECVLLLKRIFACGSAQQKKTNSSSGSSNDGPETVTSDMS